MCGLAGYSVSPASTVDRRLTAQALLAGIAERGGDASGYAQRGPGPAVTVHTQPGGASGLLDSLAVRGSSTQVLLHVRDHTKGHPSIAANNHPVRHGRVVGVHNGVIVNDDELLARHGLERQEPGMSVDSEAIFALIDSFGPGASTLEQLRGPLAAAWLDEREPEALYLARGRGRPLWIGRGRRELLFASTREALELTQRTLGLRLRPTAVGEGRILRVRAGEVDEVARFRPDRSSRGGEPAPVRTPLEAATCRARLAALAATA